MQTTNTKPQATTGIMAVSMSTATAQCAQSPCTLLDADCCCSRMLPVFVIYDLYSGLMLKSYFPVAVRV